jgi:hypothetical protein
MAHISGHPRVPKRAIRQFSSSFLSWPTLMGTKTIPYPVEGAALIPLSVAVGSAAKSIEAFHIRKRFPCDPEYAVVVPYVPWPASQSLAYWKSERTAEASHLHTHASQSVLARVPRLK